MSETASLARASSGRAWAQAGLLCALTFVSMLYVGAGMHQVDVVDLRSLLQGADFAVPLIAILIAHELGHVALSRIHGVAISPPFFIPMPFTMLGTMGAVIQQDGDIERRDALLDVAAAGPLAGLCVALPILVYGVATSPIVPMSELPANTVIEGHSIVYELVLYALHGPIPQGSDILLSSTAFAGWAGLLLTMMNLLPVAQLDGGHVAAALFGPRQNRISKIVVGLLPVAAIATSAYYGLATYAAGAHGEPLWNALQSGMHWMYWFVLLLGLAAYAGLDEPPASAPAPLHRRIAARLRRLASAVSFGLEHPPVGDAPLSPGRRVVAVLTLLLFVLLFMPSWIRMP